MNFRFLIFDFLKVENNNNNKIFEFLRVRGKGGLQLWSIEEAKRGRGRVHQIVM